MGTTLYISFLILLNMLLIQGWRPYQIEVFNFSYVVSNPEIVNFTIERFTKDNIQYFGGHTDIKKEIYHPYAHLEVIFDSGNDNYDLVYLNRTFNICEFLTRHKLHVFMDIAYKSLSQYIQMPDRCPVPKKFYKIVNFTMTEELFPPVFPEKNVKFVLSGWNQERGEKVMIGNGSAIVRVKKTYKTNIF